MIADALALAEVQHREQVDKAGKPYLGHVTRVGVRAYAASGRDDAFVVGLLHDIVEDTPVSLDGLAILFPAHIVEAVDAITHRPNEPRLDYLKRVAANELATIVKRADFRDNADPARMAAITDPDVRARLEAKYAEGATILGGLD